MKKALLIASIFTVLVGGSVWGVLAWRDFIRVERTQLLFDEIKNLAESGKKQDAHYMLLNERPTKIPEDLLSDWTKLELELVVELRNISRLEVLISRSPDVLDYNEPAALLWARHLLHLRKTTEYKKILHSWNNREENAASWFFLEVDALLVQGERDSAVKLLESKNLSGRDEQQRKIYLSLFQAKSLDQAWARLSEAYELAPSNPEVRTFSANILENIGNPTAAQREYVAAWLSDTDNPLFRDNLAEFYRRRGNLTQALKTWGTNPEEPIYDFIWMKYYFWSKVSTGKVANLPKMRKSFSTPFEQALRNLPSGQYWSESIEAGCIALNSNVAAERLTFWFRIIHDLQQKQFSKVLKDLEVNEGNATNQAPVLALALKRILEYQLNGYTKGSEFSKSTFSSEHLFIQQLFATKLPDQNHAEESVQENAFVTFVDSPQAIAAAFLATGWMRVALDLDTESNAKVPDWYSFAMTQAYRYCVGYGPAIGFAERQDSSPALDGLRGELYIASGEVATGMKILDGLRSGNDDAAYRAAWILTMAYLEKNDIKNAELVMNGQADLRNSVEGTAIAARIALARDDRTTADRIYRSITDQSVEANVYFARQAFVKKDWESARHFTQVAISMQPNEPLLYKNLEKIQQAKELMNK